MKELAKQEILAAIEAADSKKAENIVVLEMDQTSGAFTDHFVICTGGNPRQLQSIADEIELHVKRQTGTYAHQVEGYREGEWVLIDYLDFVVHIFGEERRTFYGLERLWKSARVVSMDELKALPTEESTTKPAINISPKAKKAAKKTRPIKALSTRTAAKGASRKAPAKKKASAKKSVKKK